MTAERYRVTEEAVPHMESPDVTPSSDMATTGLPAVDVKCVVAIYDVLVLHSPLKPNRSKVNTQVIKQPALRTASIDECQRLLYQPREALVIKVSKAAYMRCT